MTVSEYKAIALVSESQIQQAVIREFAHRWPKIYASGALFAVPNQGRRGKANASRMKAEGMVAGVADLILLVPRGGYNGACVELKAPGGKATKAQSEWLEARRKDGYYTMVAYGDTCAIQVFIDYLNG